MSERLVVCEHCEKTIAENAALKRRVDELLEIYNSKAEEATLEHTDLEECWKRKIELIDDNAALKRENEGLMMLLGQDTIEEFAKANGGREVHRSWRDTMLRQGRNVPEVKMVWEELPMYDRNLDCTISKDAILDYTTWVLGKIALLEEPE